MKKIVYLSLLLFCFLFLTSSVSAQCDGYAYMYSQTTPTTNTVHGFSTTYLDYCAGLYYDPEVLGTFTEILPSSPAIIGEGFSQGYADVQPAAVQFDYRSPLHSAPYTIRGDHFVIAYYQVWVEIWNPGYYWYDPFQFGFGEGIGEIYVAPDYYGYFTYVSYWVSMREYIGATTDTQIYQGQTQCLPGQQFTQTGQPCSSLPDCQSGEQFTSTGDLCPNYVPPPEPPVQPVVSVRFLDLAIKPSGLTRKNGPNHVNGQKNTQVETCISDYANPVGLPVKLRLLADDKTRNTGGHKETTHTGTRPLGNLGKREGFTGPDGCFRTNYTPPVYSGIYGVKSTISGYSSTEAYIGVGIPDLFRLRPGENYRLVGGGAEDCNAPKSSIFPNDCETFTASALGHPSNHWGIREVYDNLPKIANKYKSQFYGDNNISPAEMIHFNDMSLEWGGKFDIGLRWLATGSHDEHRDGQFGIDTRSKNIPQERHDTLMRIFNDIGFGWNDERFRPGTPPHWHLRWADYKTDGTLNNTGANLTPLQNGIDPNVATNAEWTPSTIVHPIGEAVFDRQITEDEFELWSTKLTYAKTQGFNVFFQEVKTFERQLFASQEYIARQRTDEQFVQDVFASHLFRQPTTEELSYWLHYLSTIGENQEAISNPTEPLLERTRTTTSLTRSQIRQTFLNNFQNVPDFVRVVENVVDDTYQEPVN